MVLLDPNSTFPSNVIPASAGSGHRNIGAYSDVLTGGSGNMHAGAYSDLTSSMKTPVFTSSPATAAVSASSKLSLSGFELQQSGYFYYAESGGTLTITGIKQKPDHVRRSCSNPCSHRRRAGGRHWGLGVFILRRFDQRDHPR